MPLNPNIPLSVKGAQPLNALIAGQQARQQQEMGVKRNQLLDLQTSGQQINNDRAAAENDIRSSYEGALGLVNILGQEGEVTPDRLDNARSYMQNRISAIEARGGNTEGSRRALALLEQGGIDELRQAPARVQDIMIKTGLLKGPNAGIPAGVIEFNTMASGLSDEERMKAQRIDLGLDPRAVGSGSMTIANEGMTDAVAASESVIEGSKASAKTRSKEQELRDSELISRGVLAAESTAILRRGIELLDLIETGGYNAVALRAKQIFGVEGADEGELSGNLGKAVLSQLRETFGAQFTQQEGDRLARIEAGFGKSNETNKRLLSQALQIAERTAQRARAVALKNEDQMTVEDIDDLLTFQLSESKTSLPQGVSEEDIIFTMEKNGLTRDQVIQRLGAQ